MSKQGSIPIVQIRPNRCRYCDIGYAALEYTLNEAIEAGYDITDLAGDLATKEDLERTIREKAPIFLSGFGHGNETTFTGQDAKPVLEVEVNEGICAGMIVYLLSCLTGVSLGPAIIDAGGWAYIGYTVKWVWLDQEGIGDPYLDKYAKGFFESSNTIVFAFLNGLTAKDAKQAGYDKYTEWIDYWATSDDPNAAECIHWLTHDRDNCVLLGDENAYTQVPTHLLTVNSSPDGVKFDLSDIIGVTPWSKAVAEREYVLTMPFKVSTATKLYSFDHWENGSTDPVRTINLTTDTTVTAYYVEIPAHVLTVNSNPVSGIEFTVNEATGFTPYSELLEEDTYMVTMPSRAFVDGAAYDFLRWEDGSTELTRTVDLTSDMAITAFYEEVPTCLLSVDSEPFTDISFTVDGVPHSTPCILTIFQGTYTIAFPREIEVDGQKFAFLEWEDGSRDPTRTLDLTSDTKVIAYYETAHSLTINSAPVIGIPIELDGYSIGITPVTTPVSEGSHTISVPEEVEI